MSPSTFAHRTPIAKLAPASPSRLSAITQEPYRLLFPIGLLSLALGVGIWLPALWLKPAYPGIAHAGLQIQGYLLAFILGFLMTMLPKALSLPPWSPWQLFTVAGLLFAQMGAALQTQYAWMVGLHFLLMVMVAGFLISRFRRRTNRQQKPPAPFVLIAGGLFTDILGTFLIGIHQMTDWLGDTASFALAFARLLQNQAFPLMLIAGVGSFLLPRLFAGYYRETRAAKKNGPGEAGFSIATLLQPRPSDKPIPFYALIGFLMVAGCALEASAFGGQGQWGLRLGSFMRFVAVGLACFAGIALHRLKFKVPGYLLGAQWGLWCVLIGLFMPALDPAHRLGYAHLVYLGGYGWITLSVASRVLASHGGKMSLLEGMQPWVKVSVLCMALALASRLTAEFAPAWHRGGLTLAVMAMLTAFGAWWIRFAPLVLKKP